MEDTIIRFLIASRYLSVLEVPMRQRQCIGPYDLFSLKHDLVITLQLQTSGPASPLTKETFDMAIQEVMEFAEKERGRRIPESFEVTQAKYVAIWASFTKQHQEYYRKRKYLHVAYNTDYDNFFVVIPEKGRPPKPNSAEQKIDFRLDITTTRHLDEYCRTNNIKRSQAIRDAIALLLAANSQNR